jgi:general stress protein 26
MDRQGVIDAAMELVRAGRAFIFATVDGGGFPQVRWMGGGYLEEPLTVYMACAADSRKMGQIAAHPEAQLMLQNEDFSRVATLTGTAKAVTESSVKRRVFAGIPGSAQYFSGPDDPGFGVVKFVCSRIEMLGLAEGMTPTAADI